MTDIISYYTIQCSDPERCPLLYTLTPDYPFVTIDRNLIKFSPN
jgi:hypothetical protein